jgi:hypothetical protein
MHLGSFGQFVLHAKALPGSPYDGQVVALLQVFIDPNRAQIGFLTDGFLLYRSSVHSNRIAWLSNS